MLGKFGNKNNKQANKTEIEMSDTYPASDPLVIKRDPPENL